MNKILAELLHEPALLLLCLIPFFLSTVMMAVVMMLKHERACACVIQRITFGS